MIARRYVSIVASFVLLGIGPVLSEKTSAQQDEEEIVDLGITEYELSCMSCHGVDGRGDGPDARYLETKPADLTQITMRNGGTFPADRVATIIDGRTVVATHVPREMPVWGERYRRPLPDADWDTEQEALSRIDALVDYVKSLQER